MNEIQPGRPVKGRCRLCGQQIWWVLTKSGRKMPVNHERIVVDPRYQVGKDDGRHRVVVTRAGDIVSGVVVEEEGEGRVVGARSHWATCPKAEDVRKGKKRARVFLP